MIPGVKVVPIEAWPGPMTKNRATAQFRKTVVKTRTWGDGSTYKTQDRGVDWPATVKLLRREIEFLGGKNVVLQMAVTSRDCRNDGWIRADARPAHPGVIIGFASKFGPLSYPCDTYDDWQANIRAIAVSLEALRSVDRHGVTKRGEQYKGFGQLPPAGGTTETRPEVIQRGRELIGKYGSSTAALHATHPDKGGELEDFLAVQAARGAS